MVQQIALLNAIDSLIDAALANADPDAAPPTQRQLQAFVLTSSAFLGLSYADAADVMGIKPGTVGALLHQFTQSYPHVKVFSDIWSNTSDDTPSIRRLDDVDEATEKIVYVF